MDKFKINFGVVAALVVIVVAIYLTFNTVQTESYSDKTINITTSGVIKVTNNADEPAILQTTARRTYSISVSGPENSTIRPTREGSGRDLKFVAETELAPGLTTLSVTSGSDVTFDISAAEAIQATVGARSDSGNRNIIVLAAIVCVGALAYMSFATEHMWLKFVTNRRSGSGKTSASPA